MERSYNNPEYIAYIKNNIKHSKDSYICVSCFDTKERMVKKRGHSENSKKDNLLS